MTRKEFLDDMVAFYSEDVNRRAVESGACCYRTRDGRKCAIGRYILDELYNDSIEGKNALHCNFSSNGMLPLSITSLGIYFLRQVQALHDSSGYWDENGLSEAGKEKYDEIVSGINDYCNQD